jgi:hypothetical protein
MDTGHRGRERLLIELVRALLSLAGSDALVSVTARDGVEPLLLYGKLTYPYRQPLDPEVITLGFEVDGLTLDLHLRRLADLRRWDFRAADERAAGVVLVLTDGTIIQIDQATPGTPDAPAP